MVAVVALGATLLAGVSALLSWMTRGKLTLDAGVGRSLHPLGPVTVVIDAPRELVFQQLSAPYLGRAGRAVAETVEVVERGSDLVVARHRSRVGWWTAETVESVRFEAPERISFRHLRGPVPHAVETFELSEHDERTELVYRGELGLDFWILGRSRRAILGHAHVARHRRGPPRRHQDGGRGPRRRTPPTPDAGAARVTGVSGLGGGSP